MVMTRRMGVDGIQNEKLVLVWPNIAYLKLNDALRCLQLCHLSLYQVQRNYQKDNHNYIGTPPPLWYGRLEHIIA